MTDSPPVRTSSQTRLWRRLAIAVTVLAILLIVAWRYSRPRGIAVVLAKVERGRVDLSVANTRAGTVTACRRAKLAPASGGQIAVLPVREGDRVEKGQLLLEVWNEDSAAQMRVAEEQARSAVLRSREACLRAEVAEREASRAQKLSRDGLVPDEALDRAVSSAKTLRAACDAATAEIRQSRARVDLARASLTRTELKAPFAGIVAKITGEVGEFTTPSPPGIPTPPAVDLIDDSCLYVVAPIDEVDVGRVRVGQNAFITIDALPGQRYAGRVRRIAPYVVDLEKQARTVDVEVEFASPKDTPALLVGYSADTEIVLDVRTNVLRIPTPALLEGNRVLVYDAKRGTVGERKVEVGIANWSFTEIRSGLAEGDEVVVSVERQGVKAGAHVVPEEASRE